MTGTAPIDIKVTESDGIVVVTVSGGIFYDTHAGLLEVLLEVTGRPRPRVVVDLAGVPMCDSTGLNVLARSYRQADGNGGWLRLAATQPLVQRVLIATNLSRVLPPYDSVADATADRRTD